MQITVSGILNQFHRIMQGVLFPALDEQLGPLSDKHRQLAAVLTDLPAGKGRKTAGKRLIGDELSLPGWE